MNLRLRIIGLLAAPLRLAAAAGAQAGTVARLQAERAVLQIVDRSFA
jgi:hypothetical protein